MSKVYYIGKLSSNKSKNKKIFQQVYTSYDMDTDFLDIEELKLSKHNFAYLKNELQYWQDKYSNITDEKRISHSRTGSCAGGFVGLCVLRQGGEKRRRRRSRRRNQIRPRRGKDEFRMYPYGYGQKDRGGALSQYRSHHRGEFSKAG